MTTSEEPRRLDAVLHEAVTGLEAPDPEALYAGALAWKRRRIRRRRSIGAALAAAVLAVGAGATAVSLAGTGQGTVPAGPRPSASASGAFAYPAPSASAAWTGESLGKYMAQTLWALMPAGAKPYSGGYTKWLLGSPYALTSSWGDWDASAEAALTYHGQNTVIDVTVQHASAQDGGWGSPGTCAEATAPPHPKAPCMQKQIDGGTLVVYDEHYTVTAVAPAYFWVLPHDFQIQLSIWNPQAEVVAPPLTEQQIESIITSPAWTPVLEAAPEITDCGQGELQPINQKSDEPPVGWECPVNGEKYPASTGGSPYVVKSYSPGSS